MARGGKRRRSQTIRGTRNRWRNGKLRGNNGDTIKWSKVKNERTRNKTGSAMSMLEVEGVKG